MSVPRIFLLLIVCLQIALAIECPASHFDYVGNYSLGKQDEINKTFIKISEKLITIPNTTYSPSENKTFTIFNAKPTFYYRDSEQRADVVGNDTIVIHQGRMEATITFEWKKVGLVSLSGTGTAFGLSDPIVFVKRLVVADNGTFFSYELLDCGEVLWKGIGQTFRLIRLDPPTTLEEDKNTLQQMFNWIANVTTVSNNLEQEIRKVFCYTLRNYLHDQHMPLDGQFDYIWARAGKPNVTLPFTRRGIDVKLYPNGTHLSYQVQAVNDSQWKCGNRSVPKSPQNPNIYGSSQQFISYDFYENVLRSAISRGLFDIDLTQGDWESRMFQFYAGDLYEVLDNVNSRYFASAPVTGNCKASYNSLKVLRAGSTTFNVTISFNCELNIQRTKILDFSVGLTLEVEGLPQANTIDFKLRSHTEQVSLYPYADYRILQQDLGKAMVSHSINRLYEGRLFGSGWGLSPPRDFPQFMSQQNCIFIYDSTQVPRLPEEL